MDNCKTICPRSTKTRISTCLFLPQSCDFENQNKYFLHGNSEHIWHILTVNHPVNKKRISILEVHFNLKFDITKLEPVPECNLIFLHCFDRKRQFNPLPHIDALMIYSCGKYCEKKRNSL